MFEITNGQTGENLRGQTAEQVDAYLRRHNAHSENEYLREDNRSTFENYFWQERYTVESDQKEQADVEADFNELQELMNSPTPKPTLHPLELREQERRSRWR